MSSPHHVVTSHIFRILGEGGGGGILLLVKLDDQARMSG